MSDYTGLEIAVVGIACEFPGAKGKEDFWQLLASEKEGVTHLTTEELMARGIPTSHIEDPSFVGIDGYIENKEYFDNHFFKFTPHEAKTLDPQFRTFFKTAWNALEDAAIVPDNSDKRIGVYIGARDNPIWQAYSHVLNAEGKVDGFSLSHYNNKEFIASLLSYKLNLKGPAVYLSSACSTSLVALHHAYRSLLLGDADICLAGGVSIAPSLTPGYFHKEGMIMSADGSCRPFSKDSDGTTGGEGSGVVVLKRLKDALAENDHIYAVVKGTAINNDGNRKVGFTAPSIDGQVECIRRAHAFSKVASNTISYIEAHGTGTKLGDPIEIQALNKVFGSEQDKDCLIGSVKSNIGHTGAAAGIAGFIKTCLALDKGVIPASLHYNEPNPEVPFSEGPMKVCSKTMDWPVDNAEKRRAGVSSFGIGGTNAHVVLEEAPKQQVKETKELSIVTSSGMSLSASVANKSNLVSYLETTSNTSLKNISGTLLFGRKPFEYRTACIADSISSAASNLKIRKPVKAHYGVQNVFMCSGQGSQYHKMGEGLYADYPVYQEAIDAGLRTMEKYSKTNFRSLLFGNVADAAINELENSLPLMFITEYAMAQLLASFEVKPNKLIGHSSGEYVAACLAGVFTFEEGVQIIIERSRLMQGTQRGLMLSVPMAFEEVSKLLSDRINLVAVNGPENCVLGGDEKEIEQLQFKLQGLNYDCKVIKSSHAAHSFLMESIVDEFKAFLSQFDLKKPAVPVISNVTGLEVTEELSDPDYWCKHLTSTVQFYKGIHQVIDRGNCTCIEIGPGQTLVNFARQISDSQENLILSTIRHPKNETNDSNYFLESLASLWEFGAHVDFSNFIGKDYQKVSLPGYQFDSIKYPIEADLSQLGLGFGNAEAETDDVSLYSENWNLVFETVAPATLDWLVLCGDSQEIQRFEEQNDREVKIIKLVDDASKEGGIDFGDLDALRTLVNNVTLEGTGKVVYFQSDTNESNPSSKCFFHYTNLVKVLDSKDSKEKLPFVTIVKNAYDVYGNETINPESGLLIGTCNVLMKECMNLNLSLVEIDSLDNSFSQLTAIIFSNKVGTAVVRNNKLWQRNIEKITPETKHELPYRKGGIALITGTGGMATILAEYLGEEQEMKVVLIGRSELDQKYHQEFSDKNIDYQFFQADISDTEGLTKTMEQIQAQYGEKIDFVFHTAGLGDYAGVFMGRNDEDSSKILKPKVEGTVLLDQLLQRFTVSCTVLCSSRSTEIAPIGQIAYIAGNEFQNTFAKGSKARKVVAIAWEAWKERGMGIKSVEKSGKSLDHLSGALTNLEAIDALNRVLESGFRYAVVSRQNLNQLIADYNKELESDPKESLSEDEKVQISRAGLKFDYVEPSNSLEEQLQHIWEDFFGYDGIGMEDDFFELGGDSLKLMRMHRVLCKELNIQFELVELFTHFRIKALANFLIESGLIEVEEQASKLETIKF